MVVGGGVYIFLIAAIQAQMKKGILFHNLSHSLYRLCTLLHCASPNTTYYTYQQVKFECKHLSECEKCVISALRSTLGVWKEWVVVFHYVIERDPVGKGSMQHRKEIFAVFLRNGCRNCTFK